MKKIGFSGLCILIYFIWFITPIFRYVLGGIANYVFMACVIGGLLLWILLKNKGYIRFDATLVWVALYAVCFFSFALLDLGNAGESIRVRLSYWIPLVVFSQMESDEKALVVIVKAVLLILLVNAISTYVVVVSDPEAARTLTASVTEKELVGELRLRNCGDIFLIQSLVICAPILINNIRKKVYSFVSLLALVFIAVLLAQASFTTALLVFLVTVLVSLVFNMDAPGIVKTLAFAFCTMVIFLNVEDFLGLLKQLIPNDFVQERLEQLIQANQGEDIGTNRFLLYQFSWNTFKYNWATGVGPYYFAPNAGIGNHSQILDDLARYGISGAVFYICYFIAYYKMLKKRWQMIDSANVVAPCMLAMLLFLFFNPGLMGNTESLVTLFLLPALPVLIKGRMERTKQEEEENYVENQKYN